MQEQVGEKVRAVAWSEIMPWLCLTRCFGLAISARLLVLSAMGTLLTLIGWTLFALAFSSDAQVSKQVDTYHVCPWQAVSELVPDRPPLLYSKAAPTANGPGDVAQPWFEQPRSILARRPEPLVGSWQYLSRPFAQMFQGNLNVESLAFLALCGVWAVLVWAFFGGCIARVAAVRLAAGERASWGAMLRHAGTKWRAYVAAPLFPLVTLLFLALPVALAGFLFLRLDWTVLVAGIVWPLLLLAGLLMAVLLLGLSFGWPLMWATIASEGTDSFDALSRSYNYTYQRPLHYLFYAVVAGLLGFLGWIVVVNFAGGVIALTNGAAAWGAGAERVHAVTTAAPGFDALGVGAVLIRFWIGCVKLLAVAYLFSYFWTSSTAIYFLLRRNVDATEMDEVYLDEEGQQQTFGLPPIKTDAAGAPVVDEAGAASEAD